MQLRRRSFNESAVAMLFTAALMLSGCAVKAVPDRVPTQKGAPQKNLSGISLVVLSSSQDASTFPILTETGVDVGFVGNRQAWSKKLAEALSGELARRGAALKTSASLKLNVAVTAVTLTQTGEVNRFTAKVTASSSRGWKKEYEASAEATTGFFETVDGMARRLAGLTLAEVVKVMLDDKAFMAQISKK